MPIRIPAHSRSFCFAFTAGWLLVIVSIFIYGALQRHDENSGQLSVDASQPSPPCRIQFFGSDQCSFVNSHCSRINNAGLVPYLKWYYCSAKGSRGGLLVALVLWGVIVFAGMATAADKFLAVNLASLVHSLKISENLAGVTIFAFGNGSSDLFSTLAAMNSGNGSLAIAELFGAAAFITTMVLGAIAIIQPFEVDRKSFLGDVVCFLLAASVNLILISDGSLALWESFIIVGLYVSFVAFVLIRDRRKTDVPIISFTKEDEIPEDTESIVQEVVETTALISKPVEVVTYIPDPKGRQSSEASTKTLVVENIVEGEGSSAEVSVNDHSERSSLSDWASEYEHMADIPPFIQLCETIGSIRSHGIKSLLSTFIRSPALVCVGLTTITQPEIEHASESSSDFSDSDIDPETSIVRAPERHPKEYWLLCVQLILGPQFVAWLLWSHTGTYPISTLYIISALVVCGSMAFLLINKKRLLHPGPQLHLFLSTAGFLTATAWIYILASEAVALIETLGVISNISDALLGATVFAIGNSSDDIFANISVAKRGHPVLASAACLGGPMLNTLLGVGFGSLIQIVRGHYQPYVFQVPASLFVSAASLLTGLSVVLAYVLLRGGKLDKVLGYGLMTLWVGFTAANVYVSTRS